MGKKILFSAGNSRKPTWTGHPLSPKGVRRGLANVGAVFIQLQDPAKETNRRHTEGAGTQDLKERMAGSADTGLLKASLIPPPGGGGSGPHPALLGCLALVWATRVPLLLMIFQKVICEFVLTP